MLVSGMGQVPIGTGYRKKITPIIEFDPSDSSTYADFVDQIDEYLDSNSTKLDIFSYILLQTSCRFTCMPTFSEAVKNSKAEITVLFLFLWIIRTANCFEFSTIHINIL